jgi:hypothetical protein
VPPAPFPLPIGVGEAAAAPEDDVDDAAHVTETLLDAGTDDASGSGTNRYVFSFFFISSFIFLPSQ